VFLLNSLIKKVFGFWMYINEYYKHKYFCFINDLVKSDNIFTHLTTQEKRKIFNLARSVKVGYAVEIGSYLGASSSFIAAGLNQDCILICIDTWENDAMSEGMMNTFNAHCNNTKKYSDKIMRVKGFSQNVVDEVRKITNKIDFLFIDGDHSYDSCKKDWDKYSPLLKNGSIVIFHDSGWAEGVIKVINEDAKPLMPKFEQLPNMFWGWIN
jgi:predicted O-methyltransferase YrrM